MYTVFMFLFMLVYSPKPWSKPWSNIWSNHGEHSGQDPGVPRLPLCLCVFLWLFLLVLSRSLVFHGFSLVFLGADFSQVNIRLRSVIRKAQISPRVWEFLRI